MPDPIPTHGNLQKYDVNQDGVIDHDDIVAYLAQIEQTGGSASDWAFLEALSSKGGDMTADDIFKFMDEGGTISGQNILDWVEKWGGKIDQAGLDLLQDLGVKFTPEQWHAIQDKMGLPHTDPSTTNGTGNGNGNGNTETTPSSTNHRWPPGTTIEDLKKKAAAGEDITGEDYANLVDANGKAIAKFQDFLDLMATDPSKVKASDLLAFIKNGGAVTSADLRAYVEKGGTLTAEDLAAFAKAGVQFSMDDLAAITTKLNINLTLDQLKAINPIDPTTNTPYFDENGNTTPDKLIELAKQGIHVSAQDFVGLTGPDGKPLATEQQLIAFAQAGGDITVDDVAKYLSMGGQVSGETIVALIKEGMPIDAEGLCKLAGAGVKFTDSTLEEICKLADITLTSQQYMEINPINPATGAPRFEDDQIAPTAEQMLDMQALGYVTVDGYDFTHAKLPDGVTSAATAEQIIEFLQNGGTITMAQLIEWQRGGQVVTSEQFRAMIDAGLPCTKQQFIDLCAGNHVCMKADDFVYISEKLGFKWTRQEMLDFNVLNPNGSWMFSDDSSTTDPLFDQFKSILKD